jgi:hypothetical protein
MNLKHFPDDYFGDRFTLSDLSLPRQAKGYAVQMLDTDKILDRTTGQFFALRTTELAGLFDTFDEAHAAASQWVSENCPTPQEHPLAIVPASFDDDLKRHILIYGVLCGQP